MRVRCIKDNASSFPDEYFHVGYTPSSEFNLKIGDYYTVYGINLWQGIFSYLLIGDRSERPNWYPVDAFQIIENSLPANWFVAFFDEEEKNGLKMIIGYDEIVNSVDTHHDALIDERDEQALGIFYQRKAEIEDFN
jgi:hypothetical protein